MTKYEKGVVECKEEWIDFPGAIDRRFTYREGLVLKETFYFFNESNSPKAIQKEIVYRGNVPGESYRKTVYYNGDFVTTHIGADGRSIGNVAYKDQDMSLGIDEDLPKYTP